MKISVICPSYNRASFLQECITPVIALPDAEFVLVDDGSTDSTLEIVQKLQARYGEERIVYERLAGNQGAQIARNRGMESARGELILFCDSDDVLIASGVKELADNLTQHPNLDYAYGKVVMTDSALIPLQGVSAIGSPFEDSPVEFAGYHWHTMGALYRKSYLEKVGPWNPVLTGSQDWEYQARVKMAGGIGRFVDALVGFWRQHEGGRVGTMKFRPDYVRSVADACEVILEGARGIGRSDRDLDRRVGKKLILHALEASANNSSSVRDYCLEVGLGAIHQDFQMTIYLKLLCNTPKLACYLLYKFFTVSQA